MSPNRNEWEKWLSGEEVEGLPPPWEGDRKNGKPGAKTKVDLDKVANKRTSTASSGARYRILWGGEPESIQGTHPCDALLFFGKFNGLRLSEIVKTNQGYLEWMLGQDFPDPLKHAVEYALAEYKRGKASMEVL